MYICIEAVCWGHGENDLLEFSGFVTSSTSTTTSTSSSTSSSFSSDTEVEVEVDTYTNAEFLSFLHPWTEALPYVYDSYDFDYCAEEGYVFA